MNSKRKLKSRDLYLNKLVAFKDTEPVKVITGIRRCGKSSLLKLMIEHLKDNGIDENQIIEMNFESGDYKGMTSDEVYSFVKGKCAEKRMYLFFDEIQRIDKWEDSINAFRVDLDCDIYVTGSNAYLLSSEYST
ncbi:MAG: AAA family ATPase, partial [Eubacteriales bacterium]|nr:AAA family ATPase [Eubacteriales bacterium]